MRNFTISLKKITPTVWLILAAAMTVLIIIYSEVSRNAATTAVSVCLNTTVPCMFPMLTLTYFILETGFPVKVLSLTSKLLNFLFGLSVGSLPAVISGLIGGYNSAAKAAVSLSEKGQITSEEAKRIALFFTSPGLSFTVLITGITLSGSVVVGLRLYIQGIIINITLSYLYNRTHTYLHNYTTKNSNISTSEAFINAVHQSSSAIISISFNIIFFAVISAIATEMTDSTVITNIIYLTGEVSNAVIYSVSTFPSYITAGVLGFGGFCIFMQLLPDLKALGILPVHFLSFRFLYGSLCLISEFIYTKIFPVAKHASANFQIKLTENGNTTGTIALIFLAVIYLLSVKEMKQRNFTTNKG